MFVLSIIKQNIFVKKPRFFCLYSCVVQIYQLKKTLIDTIFNKQLLKCGIIN